MAAPVSSNILSLISTERSAFGASRGDFEAYQRHCGRRVASLRHKLGLVQKKGKKGNTFTSKPVDVKTVKSDKVTEQHVHLILYDAERNWAAAHRAKSQSNKEGRAQSAEERHRMLAKLSRAIQLANTLFDLLNAQENAVLPRASAKAYQLFLSTSQQFERASDPAFCLSLLDHTTQILNLLVNKAGPNTQATALEMLDFLQPVRRISEARQANADNKQTTKQLSEQQSVSFQHVVKALQQLPSATESVTLNIKFRSQNVVVKHAKLSGLINHAEKAVTTKLAPHKTISVTAYEKVLERYGLAEDLARRLVEENELAQGRAGSEGFAALAQPLHTTLSYLTYRLLTIRIARDTLILSRSLDPRRGNPQNRHSKPKSAHQTERRKARTLATAVKLYEGLMSSFEALRELDLVESDLDLAQEIEARLEATQARRCLCTAQTYTLLGKWSEALNVNEHAVVAVRSAASALAVLPAESQSQSAVEGLKPMNLKDLESLDADVLQQKEDIVKAAFKTTGQGQEDQEPQQQQQQPKIFDIAFNYVTAFDIDSLRARAEGKEPAHATPTAPETAVAAAAEKLASTSISTNTADKTSEEEEELQPQQQQGKKGFWGLFSRGS